MKTYIGSRGVTGCHVTVHSADGVRTLPLRLDLANHSPTGFEWGYMGSGPAQLALAILADYLQDDERALRLHQRFKDDFIARLNRQEAWRITDNVIRTWFNRVQNYG